MGAMKKSTDSPDETRSFDKGRVDLVDVEGEKAGRATLEPGWKWSESVKPIAGTDSCQVDHRGYVISGSLHVATDDGTEVDLSAGDVYRIAPGHDAWVSGGEPFVAVEFESLAHYAER